MRIVFMGTPDFAVASLQHLVEGGKNVVAVITAPDKPAGRGRKLRPSAVKEYAQSQGLHLLQPTNLKDPDFLEELDALNPDLNVVVAFRMLPKVVWDMPTHGTINLHASLLPQYRGAAPINWAIINGEEISGVTTFFINEKIDTGAILQQREVAIDIDDTAGTYHDKLMDGGAQLLLETVNNIEAGTTSPRPQDHTMAKKDAPKIFKEDTRIDFDRKAADVYNFIRGLSPYPAATAVLNSGGEEFGLKIFEVSLSDDPSTKPGEVISDNKNYMKVGCNDYCLEIKSLQMAGKKRVDIKGFLNGFKIDEGTYIA